MAYKHVIGVPIVISATAVIPKQLFAMFQLLGTDRNVFVSMQKVVILVKCRKVMRVLSIVVGTEVNG